jgi:hypothetical protein
VNIHSVTQARSNNKLQAPLQQCEHADIIILIIRVYETSQIDKPNICTQTNQALLQCMPATPAAASSWWLRTHMHVNMVHVLLRE